MLTNVVKRLVYNPKNTLYNFFVVALMVAFPVVIVSVVMSFSSKSYVELVNLTSFMNYYILNTDNAINQLCLVINVISIVFGCVAFGIFMFRILKKRDKEFKSQILMGGSIGQISFAVASENVILLLVGTLLGLVISWVCGLVVGTIFSVSVILSMDCLLILVLIYLAISLIESIILPLWTQTGTTTRN